MTPTQGIDYWSDTDGDGVATAHYGKNVLFPVGAVLHSDSPQVGTWNAGVNNAVNYGAAAWPSANLGIYVPFCIDVAKTVKQLLWENGAAAGTTDIGIYDNSRNLLGNSTATNNAGTIQVVDITDIALAAGNYYLGMVSSTVTTQTYLSAVVPIPHMRMCGCQGQAIGAATLPAQATFAAVANAYLPFFGICFQGTV